MCFLSGIEEKLKLCSTKAVQEAYSKVTLIDIGLGYDEHAYNKHEHEDTCDSL